MEIARKLLADVLANAVGDALAKKFGDRFVEEDEGGTDYIYEGVKNVSYRRLPYP